VLRSRVDYDKSAGAGISGIEYKKDSKAANEIKALVIRIGVGLFKMYGRERGSDKETIFHILS
jgi:hypothetical protein